MCKKTKFEAITPYSWYGEKAKSIISEANVFNKTSIDLEFIPNILKESVMIVKAYHNELEKAKVKNKE